LRRGLGADDRQRALAQHPVDGHLGAWAWAMGKEDQHTRSEHASLKYSARETSLPRIGLRKANSSFPKNTTRDARHVNKNKNAKEENQKSFF
jgi:hypothetical protein